MIKNQIRIFENIEKLTEEFAQYLISVININSKSNIALSGGSTPKVLFKHLVKEYNQVINWGNIDFYWGDERCVPPNHSDSNFKMTNDLLLTKIIIPPDNIHRILGENKPELEALRYGNEISKNVDTKNNLPSFDLIILGMGDDGHTASIFPDQMELLHSRNICEVARHPISGQKRITLTGSVINNAKEIAFMVTGQAKSAKIKAIFNQLNDANSYPANYIKPVKGNINWFIDQSAAAML